VQQDVDAVKPGTKRWAGYSHRRHYKACVDWKLDLSATRWIQQISEDIIEIGIIHIRAGSESSYLQIENLKDSLIDR